MARWSREDPSYILTVTGREERVARNEAVARRINEGIEEAHEDEHADAFVRVICECGRDECDRVIAITVAEFEWIRSSALRFAVVRDHVIPDVERVVDETDRFAIVVKREGVPAEVAVEEDPRG